jgi:hypothetical protein
MRLLLVAAVIATIIWVICSGQPPASPSPPEPSPPTSPPPTSPPPTAAARPPVPTSSTTSPSTTTSTPPLEQLQPAAASKRRISSTAYCETGRMANGDLAHDGAVSSHQLPRGTRWEVLSGPYAGRVLTVADTGPLATFDIAMPGRCGDAIAYGRRSIEIALVP